MKVKESQMIDVHNKATGKDPFFVTSIGYADGLKERNPFLDIREHPSVSEEEIIAILDSGEEEF